MSRMRHIVGLAKIPATLSFVEEFIEDSENKLVIFVHHKDVGQIIYDSLTRDEGDWGELAQSLKEQGIKVRKLTADLSSEERYNLQVEFNENKRSILVASTLASGEGLNLQTCADCIMHERQWNPMNEEQAEGRFIRIGQTAQSVNATYVEANGTIDNNFDLINEKKRLQFHDVMNKGEAPVWSQSSFAKELAELIVAKFKKDNSGKKFAKLEK
jgi:superfamily II DNA/RNA helicase